MSILLNGNEVEEMSTMVHAVKARETGKSICNRLKETIPQHQFQVTSYTNFSTSKINQKILHFGHPFSCYRFPFKLLLEGKL